MLTRIRALLPALSGVASVFAWWRVAAIGAALLAASHGATGLYAYNAGWTNADNTHAAAVAKHVQEHAEWLVRVGAHAGVLTADDAEIEISNEQLQRRIEDAIAKHSLAAGNPAGCVPADVLQYIAKLR